VVPPPLPALVHHRQSWACVKLFHRVFTCQQVPYKKTYTKIHTRQRICCLPAHHLHPPACMASAPKTWLSDFAVTYNAANDAFQFTFVDPAIGTLYVSRVGFSVRWLPQLLATAATYFSRPSFETVQYDGVTVDAARCTAPVAATPQLLHAAILALYVPVSTTPQELQSFRHGSTPELLKTGNPDPSYIEKWATSPMSDWDYEYNSAGAFSFPDNQSKVINEDGVYDFTVCVATRGNSSLRGINLFLDTSNGSSMGSQPPNPALGSCHQSAFQPTWGGAPTLQCATLTGRAEFVAGTILRVAYVVEDDVETIADYTFWSMKLDPLVINGGAQGPPGAAGAPGTDGADGVVQTVTAVYPLVASGTAADRVIEHSPVGGGPITITNPYQITFDQFGHRTASTTMAAPFNNIQSTSQITLTSGGALPTRTLTATHATNFVGAGTFTNVASLSTNSTGHVTGAVSGQPPEILANKNQPNGYAGLGPLGKIAASQLPALVVTDTYIVGPQADLVTLTAAEKGDIGIVTADPDNTLEGAWILQADPYSTLSNWVRLLPPGAGILYTVNGKIGPNAILGADDITTGTLPIAQLPALSVTGDVTGTGVAGTGSIPTTLTPTGVGAVTVTNADLTIGADGRIYAASNGSTGAAGTMLRSFYGPTDNFSNPPPATVIPFTFTATRETGTRTYTGAEVASGLHIRFTSQIDAGTSPSIVLYVEYNGGFLPLATLDSSATQGMSIDADIWTSTDDNTTVTNQALWTSAVRYSVNNIINGTARLISQGPVHYTTTIAAVAATSYTFTPQILWTTSSGATAGTSKGYMTIDRY